MKPIEQLTKEYLAAHTGLHEVSVEMDVLLTVVGAAFEDGFTVCEKERSHYKETLERIARAPDASGLTLSRIAEQAINASQEDKL